MPQTQTLYTNNARTTLNGAITATASTIVVSNAAKFPIISSAGQQFYITLDDGTNTEIVKVGGVSGNTFSSCARGQDGTTGVVFASGAVVSHRLVAQNIRELARLDDRMGNLTDITYLTDPALLNGNTYLVAGTTVEGAPNIAMISAAYGGYCWTFVAYPTVAASTTVPAGCTTTRVPYTAANTAFPDTFSKAYIIEFITGALRGVCRFVSSTDSTGINFSPALPTAATSGDVFTIYRYMGKNISDAIGTINVHLGTLDTTTAAHTGQISSLNSTVSTNTANIATNTSNISALSTSKAPLNSPGLTGVPTAPTPASTDNSTKIATTAFVNNIFNANQSLTTNGETMLPGGFQMKWALVTVSGSGTSYTWTGLGVSGFTNACFGITANSDHSTGPMDIVSYNTSGFTLDNNGDAGSCTVCVWAWGH